MDRLFTSWKLKQFTIRNRICVPPLVIQSWGDGSGRVGEKNIAHYRALTQGGAGLVIQEATAVLPVGSRRANTAVCRRTRNWLAAH